MRAPVQGDDTLNEDLNFGHAIGYKTGLANS